MKMLHRLVLSAHVGPFVGAFVTLMFIFLLQTLMKFIDRIVGKGLELGVIVEWVALNLAWVVVLAVPMAVLVATLMAFGSLTQSHEITAMKAAGISLFRMMIPVLIASAGLVGLMIWFNNRVLPEANFRASQLLSDISRARPSLAFTPGIVSTELTGYSVLVKSSDPATGELLDMTIFDFGYRGGEQRLITARRGKLSLTADNRFLLMTLADGEIHTRTPQDRDRYTLTAFGKLQIRLAGDEMGTFQRSALDNRRRGDRELSAAVMRSYVDSLKMLESTERVRLRDSARAAVSRLVPVPSARTLPPPVGTDTSFLSLDGLPTGSQVDILNAAATAAERLATAAQASADQVVQRRDDQDKYLVEIHKKYSIPVACFIFVLIGAPLGVMARRGGVGIGAGLSLAFFLIYWVFLIGGEKLADRGVVSPFWAMWSANALMGTLGVYLTLRMMKESMLIPWGKLIHRLPVGLRRAVESEEDEAELVGTTDL